MKIYLNGILYAAGVALDSVEAEIFGITTHHSKRVAYLSVRLAGAMGFSPERLSDIAAAAILHDNALTEYIAAERLSGNSPGNVMTDLSAHCIAGEKNIERLPFYPPIKGAVLYHHENADGSGPFGLVGTDTPLFARMIHLADQFDAQFGAGAFTRDDYEGALVWLDKGRGTLFDEQLLRQFTDVFNYAELKLFYDSDIQTLLESVLPRSGVDYGNDELIRLSRLFAGIVDYKSHFTSTHSQGIAKKAYMMGRFYGYDDELCTRLYMAGALHDIGKLFISNSILEKAGRLTTEEFEIMKSHAYLSYSVLKGFYGLEEEASWAYLHHEKLDGSGYPFGKAASELNHFHRLIACVDIYQALTEQRPYRDGSSHGEAIAMLRSMAERGQLDAGIVSDMDACFSVQKQDASDSPA